MRHAAHGFLLLLASIVPALADENTSWDSVRSALFGDRILQEAGPVISLDAPYRTENDPRTDLGAQVTAPAGAAIGKIWVVLDENPMPVSAIFALAKPLPTFFFNLTLRINGPTPLHVVAETTDGRLFVAESFVKTSGIGACSAPPGTDPEIALLTLGNMEISVSNLPPGVGATQIANLAAGLGRMDVDIQHPSHSGMQMDQISLLFVPMRYVEDVAIDLDGSPYVEMTGSISLAENPRVGLSVPRSTGSVDVTITDTDGFVSTTHKDLAGF